MLALSNCLTLSVIRPFMLYTLYVHAVTGQTWGMLFFPHYNPPAFLHKTFYACFEPQIGVIVQRGYSNLIPFLRCSLYHIMRSQNGSKCHNFKSLLPRRIHGSPHKQTVYPEKWLCFLFISWGSELEWWCVILRLKWT